MFRRCVLEGLGVNFYFGGTSLLIVVGVAMDTINQIEAQFIMRHYEGFTPRSGRIRGPSLIGSCESHRTVRLTGLREGHAGKDVESLPGDPPHLDRGYAAGPDPFRIGGGKTMEATMHSGGLVSDRGGNEMVKERLSEADAAKGFILDGYPRTLDQAAHLAAWLVGRGIREVVIHLAVDYNIIIARLTGRRQCPLCGTLYNVASHPPKVDGVCDLDGQTTGYPGRRQRDRDSRAVGRV